MSNYLLNEAKKNKNDEFYTQLPDIEKEMAWYDFRDKVVYCPCDGEKSNFVKYFTEKNLGLKEFLFSSDDFHSEESIELLKRADIVITNPPFSLFREFFAQLIEHEKKFLIIGYLLASTYYDIFPLLKAGRARVCPTRKFFYDLPSGDVMQRNDTRWYTNIFNRVPPPLPLRNFVPEEYQTYTNFPAINVNSIGDIPDYDGVMGVPVSFFGYHNPQQFKIIGNGHGEDGKNLTLSDRMPFYRVLIQKI